MTNRTTSIDALQFKALLIARAYVYEAFHHLCGGTPNSELLEALSSNVSQDIFEEYASSEEILALRDLLKAYGEMDAQASESFLDKAKDEYTRVFIGPMALPASPYESPYTGSHDMALLQENTLVVRSIYRENGLEPKRLHAVPDDHIAFMCSFMAKRARRACDLFEEGKEDALSQRLQSQGEFLAFHMLGWLQVFSESVATSDAASSNVVFPVALKALSSFVESDHAFVLEGVAWLNGGSTEDSRGSFEQEEACKQDVVAQIEDALAKAKEAYARLCEIMQVGLEDFSFVKIGSNS